jgi:hypothetical protein
LPGEIQREDALHDQARFSARISSPTGQESARECPPLPGENRGEDAPESLIGMARIMHQARISSGMPAATRRESGRGCTGITDRHSPDYAPGENQLRVALHYQTRFSARMPSPTRRDSARGCPSLPDEIQCRDALPYQGRVRVGSFFWLLHRKSSPSPHQYCSEHPG